MHQRPLLSGITLGVLTACLLPVGDSKAKSIAPAETQTPAVSRYAATDLEPADRAALTALIATKQAVWAARTSTAAHHAERDRALAEVKVRKTARGVMLPMGEVLFAPDQSEPTAATMRKLSPLVSLLRAQPHRTVRIAGYADSSGSESYNLDLSQRRADTVRDFLIANGIAPRRITARGYGEAPSVTSDTAGAGRHENRRVDVVVRR